MMELVMELAANFFIEPLYLMPSIVNAQLHQRKVFSLAFAMGKVYSLFAGPISGHCSPIRLVRVVCAFCRELQSAEGDK